MESLEDSASKDSEESQRIREKLIRDSKMKKSKNIDEEIQR